MPRLRRARVGPAGPTEPPASIAVHTLRPADLAGAPGPGEAADRLIELTAGRVLVAHAAWIETSFLNRAFRRRGRRLASPVVDTAALARAAGHAPDAGPQPSLEALATRLGLPVHTPHHALGDALTTAQLFIALAARMEGRAGLTVRTLVRLSRHQPDL